MFIVHSSCADTVWSTTGESAQPVKILTGIGQFYAAMIPRMWRQLHDSGDRSVEIVEDGRAISKVANWAGHHRVLCMLSTSLMCAIFEQMGKKNVKWTCTRCISRDGGSECVYEVRWVS